MPYPGGNENGEMSYYLNSQQISVIAAMTDPSEIDSAVAAKFSEDGLDPVLTEQVIGVISKAGIEFYQQPAKFG